MGLTAVKGFPEDCGRGETDRHNKRLQRYGMESNLFHYEKGHLVRKARVEKKKKCQRVRY